MTQREHYEQAALIAWADNPRTREQWPDLEMLFAVPNGGARHPAVAAKLKAEGVRRGVPDLICLQPRGPYCGLAIELKATGGRPTPEQREWIARLEARGYCAHVCVGWERAREVIEEYLGIEV